MNSSLDRIISYTNPKTHFFYLTLSYILLKEYNLLQNWLNLLVKLFSQKKEEKKKILK